jgi:hypothetical protein
MLNGRVLLFWIVTLLEVAERLNRPAMEDNQRVTYTYTVSADVTGLLSV